MQSFDEDGESLLCRKMWSYVEPDWSKAYLYNERCDRQLILMVLQTQQSVKFL